jgi:transcriptional regulator with XRE-family HTH domain
MLAPVLKDGLSAYEIGDRIRALRLKKKIGLVALSGHTGLSAALLSKIERGRLFPTLPTLLRIALVFSVDLAYFFSAPREKPVVAVGRRRERLRFPERPGRDAAYEFESIDYGATERKTSTYVARFATPRASSPHAHDGAETIFVLTGTLAVQIGADEYVLAEGDSVYFDSSQPHTYRRAGRQACSAVVVTAP